MVELLRVAGRKSFISFISDLESFHSDMDFEVYEEFCRLCKREQGIGFDLKSVSEQEARSLIKSFTKMIATHHYDTHNVLILLKRAYPKGFLSKHKFAVIDICRTVTKLRITDENLMKSISRAFHQKLTTKDLKADENFYFFALQFFSKLPNKQHFNGLLSAM